MLFAHAIMPVMTRKNNGILTTVVLPVLVTLLIVSCSPPRRHSLGGFVAIDPIEGWHRTMPIEFAPQYSDSTATYDISVAVRHTNDFNYKALPLVVDLIDDAGIFKRYSVTMAVADDYGDWRGTGFGTLFQCRAVVARGVRAEQARRVVVWQALADTVTLTHITDVGILVDKH